MLVNGVNSTLSQPSTLSIYDYKFWKGKEVKPIDKKRHGAGIALGTLCAATIFCAGILNLKIRGKYYVPPKFVELLDQTKGLNKIKEFPTTVAELKNKILYPILATDKGYKVFEKSDQVKSGLILTGDSVSDVSRVINALKEHAAELKFKVVTCPFDGANQRVSARRWVHNAFKEAQENYLYRNQHTFIDVGNIDALTAIKSDKSTFSTIEKLLYESKKNTYRGVCWIGQCDQVQELPFFYNTSPVLITKLTK